MGSERPSWDLPDLLSTLLRRTLACGPGVSFGREAYRLPADRRGDGGARRSACAAVRGAVRAAATPPRRQGAGGLERVDDCCLCARGAGQPRERQRGGMIPAIISSEDLPHRVNHPLANDPIGSHAGNTIGSASSASWNSGERALRLAAISNMCSSNHESFMT